MGGGGSGWEHCWDQRASGHFSRKRTNTQASSKLSYSSTSTSGWSPQPEKWFNHSCSQWRFGDRQQAQRGTINSLPSGTAPHPALCSESLTQGRHSSALGTSKSHSQLPKASEALCHVFIKRLQLIALHFLAFFYTHTSQGRVPSLPGHSSWLKGQPCPCLKASAPAPAHPPGYKADVEQR